MDIRIGAAWESQGHPKLDGWAWYRLEVEIPAHWDARDARDAFLSFEGVDEAAIFRPVTPGTVGFIPGIEMLK